MNFLLSDQRDTECWKLGYVERQFSVCMPTNSLSKVYGRKTSGEKRSLGVVESACDGLCELVDVLILGVDDGTERRA